MVLSTLRTHVTSFYGSKRRLVVRAIVGLLSPRRRKQLQGFAALSTEENFRAMRVGPWREYAAITENLSALMTLRPALAACEVHGLA